MLRTSRQLLALAVVCGALLGLLNWAFGNDQGEPDWLTGVLAFGSLILLVCGVMALIATLKFAIQGFLRKKE